MLASFSRVRSRLQYLAEIRLVHLFAPVVLIGQISKFDYRYNANI